jgi:hypothetical protein
MELIASKATAVAEIVEPSSTGVKGFDPITIIMIIQTIFQAYECLRHDGVLAQQTIASLSLFQRVKLRLLIAQQVGWADAGRLMKAIVQIGQTLSADELTQMASEVSHATSH